MDFVNVNGCRIAFERAGNGPDVLLFHGILSDSRFWRQQIDELATSYTVWAWDAPGAGQTDDPDEFIGIEGFADFADGFMGAVGVEKAHVGGLSLGGVFVLALYRKYPERVRSMLLADTHAGWRGSLTAEECAARLAEALLDSERPPEEFIPSWIPGLLTDSAPEFLRFGLTSAMSQFHPVGYRAMARALAEADMSVLLPNIEVPTLLVWGADDRRSPIEVGEQFVRTIPGSELEVIKAAGHVSSLEQPKLFNECARAFWQRLDA